LTRSRLVLTNGQGGTQFSSAEPKEEKKNMVSQVKQKRYLPWRRRPKSTTEKLAGHKTEKVGGNTVILKTNPSFAEKRQWRGGAEANGTPACRTTIGDEFFFDGVAFPKKEEKRSRRKNKAEDCGRQGEKKRNFWVGGKGLKGIHLLAIQRKGGRVSRGMICFKSKGGQKKRKGWFLRH